MGSLAGHCIAGTFVLLYGLWCAFAAVWLDVNKSTSPETKAEKLRASLKNKSWIPVPCCPKIPLEPIFKIVLALLAILINAFFDIVPDENGHKHLITIVYRVRDTNGTLNDLGKLDHIVIYCSVALSGLVDIISVCCTLPEKASRFFMGISFLIEGLVFHNHLADRDEQNVHIHTLLIYVIAVSVVFAFLRMKTSINFRINIGLAFSMILQGTWLIQAGFTLFPPKGISLLTARHERSKNNYLSLCFAVHIMVISVALLLLWMVMNRVMKRFARLKSPCLEESRSLMEEDAASIEMVDTKN